MQLVRKSDLTTFTLNLGDFSRRGSPAINVSQTLRARARGVRKEHFAG